MALAFIDGQVSATHEMHKRLAFKRFAVKVKDESQQKFDSKRQKLKNAFGPFPLMMLQTFHRSKVQTIDLISVSHFLERLWLVNRFSNIAIGQG